jgi:hypothetical protein
MAANVAVHSSFVTLLESQFYNVCVPTHVDTQNALAPLIGCTGTCRLPQQQQQQQQQLARSKQKEAGAEAEAARAAARERLQEQEHG